MTLSPLFLASFILSTAFCISLSSKGLCKSSNFQSIINSQFSNLFCKISFITIKGYNETKVEYAAKAIYNFLKEKNNKLDILGPNRNAFYKINNEYKFNIVIKYQEEEYKTLYPLLKYINNYFAESFSTEKITITIDNFAQDYI